MVASLKARQLSDHKYSRNPNRVIPSHPSNNRQTVKKYLTTGQFRLKKAGCEKAAGFSGSRDINCKNLNGDLQKLVVV